MNHLTLEPQPVRTEGAGEAHQRLTALTTFSLAPGGLLMTGVADAPILTTASWPEEVPVPEVWLFPTYVQLAQLGQLEQDWDSYGAAPISQHAIAGARQFLSLIREELADDFDEGIRPYSVVPLADGGVQLEWRRGRAALELEVGPNGGLGCLFMHDHETGRVYEENDDISTPDALGFVTRALRS